MKTTLLALTKYADLMYVQNMPCHMELLPNTNFVIFKDYMYREIGQADAGQEVIVNWLGEGNVTGRWQNTATNTQHCKFYMIRPLNRDDIP